MTMDPKAPPDIVEKHENDMRQVVEGLESIHPTVIYIPGNVFTEPNTANSEQILF